MNPTEIKYKVYWVGAIDWDIREFHGYSTPTGTTYNSYLVLDDKITLFDTVKKPFFGEMMTRIGKIVDPARIDYLVVNHVEMDHSGGIPEALDLIRPEKVFCSAMAKKALVEHFGREDWPYEVVKSGQNLKLGNKTVQFLETRMLHWPDSMFSYLVEDRLLISSDAFGQHWATSERYDDEVDFPRLMRHAAKYYANILLPYSPLVRKLIQTVAELGIKIDLIAPDHGLIWRNKPSSIVSAYDTWSRQQSAPKALVIYDTMWHSTERMAKAIALGLNQENVHYKMMNLRCCHRSDIVTEMLDARALIFGSPTLNNGMLPTMADILCYIKGLRPLNKIAAAFGSYGWSGEAVKLINEELDKMKLTVVDPGVRGKYVPTAQVEEDCIELGRKVAQAIKEAD